MPRKPGVAAVWGRYSDFPAPLRAQLSEVSEEWAAQKHVPEMGFTLGGIDELDDDEVLCCLAVDAEGQVQGVTSWLPVYEDGQLVSWTLDFMRRRGDAFPGVMEFLIASAVLELKRTVEVISLSGSPLAKDRAGDEAAGRSDAGTASGNAAGNASGGSASGQRGWPESWTWWAGPWNPSTASARWQLSNRALNRTTARFIFITRIRCNCPPWAGP